MRAAGGKLPVRVSSITRMERPIKTKPGYVTKNSIMKSGEVSPLLRKSSSGVVRRSAPSAQSPELESRVQNQSHRPGDVAGRFFFGHSQSSLEFFYLATLT